MREKQKQTKPKQTTKQTRNGETEQFEKRKLSLNFWVSYLTSHSVHGSTREASKGKEIRLSGPSFLKCRIPFALLSN